MLDVELRESKELRGCWCLCCLEFRPSIGPGEGRAGAEISSSALGLFDLEGLGSVRQTSREQLCVPSHWHQRVPSGRQGLGEGG